MSERPTVNPEEDPRVQNAVLRQELEDLASGRAMMREDLIEISSQRDQAELERDTDALTGAASQRIYLQEIERIQQSGLEAPAVFIDLDNLKKINDTFSQSKGDEAIKLLAQAAMNAAESLNLPRNRVTRAGGDEFVIFLRQGEDQFAEALMEAIKQEFNALELPEELNDISYTAHIGTTLEAAEKAVKQQKADRPAEERYR